MTISVAILTISDSAVAGTREDASGPALAQRCRELSWEIVATALVADEEPAIETRLKEWADAGAATLILTTGGTGVAARDVTPEATRRVLDREIPGLAELMRQKGLEQTKFSVMSRALAGTRKRSLIVNLPGSPRGALFSLQTIESVVPHTIELLQGSTCHR
ncbi:MAG: MogA/MoaB family molybdenum cofactor biosynthesis protein [Bryobacteraceae bacterium]|jgi:molybdopterin adenylyltransferase